MDRVFEAELERGCGLSLAWYDVLAALGRRGASGSRPVKAVRMGELADAVLISRSWLTRRVDAMEAAGLVERYAAAGDGRGVCLRLTREGKRVLTRAERSQTRSIERHVAAHVDGAELAAIEAAMARIEAAARQVIGGTAG
jgi:DNA-binding MarR family transcriptional regulator